VPLANDLCVKFFDFYHDETTWHSQSWRCVLRVKEIDPLGLATENTIFNETFPTAEMHLTQPSSPESSKRKQDQHGDSKMSPKPIYLSHTMRQPATVAVLEQANSQPDILSAWAAEVGP
jgi:hypothetical protein